MVESLNPSAAPSTVPAAPAPVRPSRAAEVEGAAAFGPAATVGPDRSAAHASPAAAPVKETPPPLRLSVGRADNGVFVYTLKNPDTGAVVAVIPRAELAQAQGVGGTVDRKV